MEVIKLKIQSYADRECVITGLANAGYHVWVEESSGWQLSRYYVCFEVKEQKNG